MQYYLVGGAVRDTLLGKSIQDRDYVVVGATPQEMINAGFRPVGNDFPVFIHPVTHEEYALARTERKIALGYKGFNFYTGPDVTLEQDLQRRDITINAMAQAIDQDGQPQGSIIDPYGGQRDVHQKILRHVSPAFVEDPVRILRLARFAARFHDFAIASETNILMREMVRNGEVDALVAERVWQELARGLTESHPQKMLMVLHHCGALTRIFSEFKRPIINQRNFIHDLSTNKVFVNGDVNQAWMKSLSITVPYKATLVIRFAVLMYIFCKGDEKTRALDELKIFCRRLRVPKECAIFAQIVLNQSEKLIQSTMVTPAQLVDVLQSCDAWRRPERFNDILKACVFIKADFDEDGFIDYLHQAYVATQKIDISAIAAAFMQQGPRAIANAINKARVTAIEQQQNSRNNKAL